MSVQIGDLEWIVVQTFAVDAMAFAGNVGRAFAGDVGRAFADDDFGTHELQFAAHDVGCRFLE